MTPTPTDKEQALPQFHMTENGPRHRSMVTWSGALADCGPMTVAHLSAQIAALDPSTRARVLEPYLDQYSSDMTRAYDETCASLTTARAEVERLRAFVKLALSRSIDDDVSEPLRAALDAHEPKEPT